MRPAVGVALDARLCVAQVFCGRPPVTADAIKPEDYFAVVKLAGTQYKVTQGDVVITEKIKEAKVGEIMDIDEVLLLGNVNQTIVGLPLVEGAKVRARVEEQTLDAKIDIFKKKRRKNYRRWNGFRRQVTVLRVMESSPSMPKTRDV
ncbi:Ribosomal protein L21-like [Phytophthora cactorum]|nr:Ribosomal protein L21-like [Phytophthora cactorum]